MKDMRESVKDTSSVNHTDALLTVLDKVFNQDKLLQNTLSSPVQPLHIHSLVLTTMVIVDRRLEQRDLIQQLQSRSQALTLRINEIIDHLFEELNTQRNALAHQQIKLQKLQGLYNSKFGKSVELEVINLYYRWPGILMLR